MCEFEDIYPGQIWDDRWCDTIDIRYRSDSNQFGWRLIGKGAAYSNTQKYHLLLCFVQIVSVGKGQPSVLSFFSYLSSNSHIRGKGPGATYFCVEG